MSGNNSRESSRHRRIGTKTSLATVISANKKDSGPTSTSKALLVTVIAPRKIATKPAEQPEEVMQTLISQVPKTILVDDKLEKNEEEDEATKEAVQADDKDKVVPPHDSEAEAATPKSGNPSKTDPSKEVPSSEVSSKATSKAEEEEEEEELPVTEEEKAAVTVGKDPEEANINVEELLRIAFRALLEDYHLLNVPTYSLVLDKHGEGDQVEEESWIRIDVMAKPASLGVLLERLERIGVGTTVGTLTILKAELCRTASPYAHLAEDADESKKKDSDDDDDDDDDDDTDDSKNSETAPNGNKKKDPEQEKLDEEQAEQEKLLTERRIEEARMEWKNAATRLRIEQVRELIDEQAAMTFDFLALLTVASILAGVGLITDNTVVIVASMLVSPIMGPVLGLTFGSRVQDWPLVRKSLLNEMLALLGCIVIGAFTGLGAAFTDLAEDWPTNEMEIRGEYTGLLTGIAVAIPSGMGVCLSILGGNTSSLVGVAISASLLPPAVNTGICLIYAIFENAGMVENDNKNAGEFAIIGGISLALTALNIVCIWISGLVMFEIKEVAPIQSKSAFWQNDLKVARELNTSSSTKEPAPVDVKIIRDGIKTALNRNRAKADKVGDVRIRPPAKKKTLLDSKTTLNAALALSARHRRLASKGWASDLVSGEMQRDDDDDDVQYVGLEDMANLLGFADEEDEENAPIDHAAVARKLGRGRYL